MTSAPPRAAGARAPSCGDARRLPGRHRPGRLRRRRLELRRPRPPRRAAARSASSTTPARPSRSTRPPRASSPPTGRAPRSCSRSASRRSRVGDRDTYRNWVGAGRGPARLDRRDRRALRAEPGEDRRAEARPHRAGVRRARQGPRQARGDRARRRPRRLRAEQGLAEDRVGGDARRDAQARHAAGQGRGGQGAAEVDRHGDRRAGPAHQGRRARRRQRRADADLGRRQARHPALRRRLGDGRGAAPARPGNGFEGKHEDYSFTEVGLEGLRQVGDTDWLLTLAQKQDTKEELNAFGAWKDNPVFKKLPVVKAGRVHEIGGDNWTWGGPLSASRLATKIADVLAAPESS